MRILYHRKLVDPFIFEVTVQASETVTLPLGASGESDRAFFDFYVDWGDGTIEYLNNSADSTRQHTYADAGAYDVKITGKCNYFADWSNVAFKTQLTKIKRWGRCDFRVLSFRYCINLTTLPSGPITGSNLLSSAWFMFGGCTSLQSIPTGLFDLTPLIDGFRGTFEDCNSLTGSIPTDLFKNNTLATDFRTTFKNCWDLDGSIPQGLFTYTTQAVDFNMTFQNCWDLTGSIPTDLFSYVNASGFDSTFYGCAGLSGSIPTGFFDTCTASTGFNFTFYFCSGLTGNIPTDLFKYNINATSFWQTFRNCTGLTGSIPTLFDTNVDATNFDGTFMDCSGLTGAIPSGIFTNNVLATTFSDVFRGTSVTSFSSTMFNTNTVATDMGSMFYDCHHISQTIPAELFKYNTQATNFAYIFRTCSGLTGSIPADIFSYAPNATSVEAAFTGCSGLTGTIPGALLTNNSSITGFGLRNLFNQCTGLTGAIPSGLFTNQTLVNTMQGVFAQCYGLTSIPSGLFDTNVNVGNGTTIGFDTTFQDCYSIDSVPTLLFANNTYATNFYRTFYGCNDLQLNRNIFCSDANISTRFLDQSPRFEETFSRPLWTGTQGEAPFLWAFTYGTGTPIKTDCFAREGNKIESLSNYCDIPNEWGGAGCTSSYSIQHAANVAVSNGAWNNFASLGTNLRIDDNTYVTTQSASYTDGVMRDFGFEIPSGATITGIQVLVQWKLNYAFAGGAIKINLSKDGTNWGTESAPQSVASATEALKTFGSVDSLWGLSWTAADINSSNLSLKLSGYIGNAAYTMSVEYVWLKVYYSAVPPIFSNINYGLQYNYYAFNNAANIANTGWRVAVEADYANMRDILQGSATDWNTNTVGTALNSPGNTYWDFYTGVDKTNSSGMNFRGTGYISDYGWTYSFRQQSTFWTGAYRYPTTSKGAVATMYSGPLFVNTNCSNNGGASIRLIKEDSTDPGFYTGNDGKVYRTKKIGDLVWTADSLAETKYRTGADIPYASQSAWNGYGVATTGCWGYVNQDSNTM